MTRSAALDRIANLIRFGTVAERDLSRALVRVRSGGLLSDWLPWLVPHAGAGRTDWSPPALGEQVLVLCVEGDATAGVVLRALYSDDVAPPANAGDVHRSVYTDGAVVEYDAAAHALTATLPAGATATLTADGGITLNGPVTINGTCDISETLTVAADIDSSGTLTASTDVVGGGISLKGHKHSGVQTGSGVTGGPQ